MRDKELHKLCIRVAKDLGITPERINYYSHHADSLAFADRMAKTAFLFDKNTDAVRELREYLYDLEDTTGTLEKIRWSK